MRPVLFTIAGLPVQSYGLSKVLAAFAAAWLLRRLFIRHGLPGDHAYALVLGATVWGFVGAKLYYLAEHARTLTWHDLGGMGFTWYGGLLAGAAAVVVTARKRGLPIATVAGLVAAPLSLAYGIGRLGCLLSGDGTYGKPSRLPWAMSFPNGAVPTSVAVQPTPLYEAIIAFAVAALLWWMVKRWHPLVVFAFYLLVSGTARLGIEALRINRPVLLGLTQPQVWSLLLIAVGVGLGVMLVSRGRSRQVVP